MDDTRWEAFLFGFVRNRTGLMQMTRAPRRSSIG